MGERKRETVKERKREREGGSERERKTSRVRESCVFSSVGRRTCV